MIMTEMLLVCSRFKLFLILLMTLLAEALDTDRQHRIVLNHQHAGVDNRIAETTKLAT